MLVPDIERAHALENSADFVGALQVYYQAFKQNSCDSDAILGIAQNAMTLDNPELALEFFVKLLILDHRNPWGFLGRAQVMIRYNQLNRAISDIRRALELEVSPSEIRIDCAAALNDCGAYAAALDALEPVRDQFGDDPDFCVEWGFASIAAGREDPDLGRMLEKCIQDDPLVFLCRCALAKKNGEELASDQIAAVIEENPELESRAAALGLI